MINSVWYPHPQLFSETHVKLEILDEQDVPIDLPLMVPGERFSIKVRVTLLGDWRETLGVDLAKGLYLSCLLYDVGSKTCVPSLVSHVTQPSAFDIHEVPIDISLCDFAADLSIWARLVMVGAQGSIHEPNSIVWEERPTIIKTGAQAFAAFGTVNEPASPWPWRLDWDGSFDHSFDDPSPPFIIILNMAHPVCRKAKVDELSMKALRRAAMTDCIAEIFVDAIAEGLHRDTVIEVDPGSLEGLFRSFMATRAPAALRSLNAGSLDFRRRDQVLNALRATAQSYLP